MMIYRNRKTGRFVKVETFIKTSTPSQDVFWVHTKKGRKMMSPMALERNFEKFSD